MKPKPKHPDITKFGYLLFYSSSRDDWYAAYETDKGSAWYKWNENGFDLVDRYTLPKDLTTVTDEINLDLEFAKALEGSLSEWLSKNDEEAYKDL